MNDLVQIVASTIFEYPFRPRTAAAQNHAPARLQRVLEDGGGVGPDSSIPRPGLPGPALSEISTIVAAASGSDAETEPSLARAPNGHMLVAFTAYRGNSPSTIGYVWSEDGGSTWTAPEYLDLKCSGYGVFCNVTTTFDNDGRAVISFVASELDANLNRKNTLVLIARTEPGGRGFAIGSALGFAAEIYRPWILTTVDGAIWVAAAAGPSPFKLQVFRAKKGEVPLGSMPTIARDGLGRVHTFLYGAPDFDTNGEFSSGFWNKEGTPIAFKKQGYARITKQRGGPRWIGDYIQVAPVADGVGVVYSDNEGSAAHIRFVGVR